MLPFIFGRELQEGEQALRDFRAYCAAAVDVILAAPPADPTDQSAWAQLQRIAHKAGLGPGSRAAATAAAANDATAAAASTAIGTSSNGAGASADKAATLSGSGGGASEGSASPAAPDASGRPLEAEPTLSQLQAEIATLIVAGYETTANALTWALFALAVHPEAQQRCRQELQSLGLLRPLRQQLQQHVAPAAAPALAFAAAGRSSSDGGGSSSTGAAAPSGVGAASASSSPPAAPPLSSSPLTSCLTVEALDQMPYITAVLHESMRLYSTTPNGTIRKTEVSGHQQLLRASHSTAQHEDVIDVINVIGTLMEHDSRQACRL